MQTIGLMQDTLTSSDLIFDRIYKELSGAQSDILVAMAWFTEPRLFEVLVGRIKQNVQVSLIVSDVPDNEKLDFAYLESLGAEVIKIRNVGWGMMHQKFCVIDRKIAITGSYNWSVNAKNNHESVIVTNHEKTVAELLRTFFNIRGRAIRINNGETVDGIEDDEKIDMEPMLTGVVEEKKKTSFQEESLVEFRRVLDNIIATEVGSFDKELLKSGGYNRAAENNGDHQILSQAMDSLYSNFINEIEVIEEKKTRLKVKIDEQQKISIANMELRTESEIVALQNRYLVDAQNTETSVVGFDKQIDEVKLTIKSNNETTITFMESQVALLRKQIRDISVEFVKPPQNKFLLWVFGCISIFLLLYLFVFYSSVAYILIFSKEDLQAILASGGMSTEVPEVFNAHAMSKIWTKGLGGVLFTLLFIFIPITLSLFPLFSVPLEEKKFTKGDESVRAAAAAKKWLTHYGGTLLATFFTIIVDTFVAYKVAVNINAIEYITRKTDHLISFEEVLTQSNFWLVFVLGMLGIILFRKVVGKLYELYSLGNITYQDAKLKCQADALEYEVSEQLTKINNVQLENDRLAIQLSSLDKEKNACEKRLRDMPILQSDERNLLQQQLISYNEKLGNIANIYKSQIDNDKLPISKAEMENRINIFMEGWSKYLYDIYSINKAELKTSDAIREIENWLKGLSFQSRKVHEFSN